MFYEGALFIRLSVNSCVRLCQLHYRLMGDVELPEILNFMKYPGRSQREFFYFHRDATGIMDCAVCVIDRFDFRR